MKRYKLIETRIQNGLTQKQVANQCEISRVHYARIESGLGVPSLYLAIRIFNVVTKYKFVDAFDCLTDMFDVMEPFEKSQNVPHAEHTNRRTFEDSDDLDLYNDI